MAVGGEVAAPALPPSRVSRQTAGRAVDALLKWLRAHLKQNKAQLLAAGDELLYLILILKKIPHRGRTNAYHIPLPHPLHDLSSTSACLIVDDRPKSPLSAAAAKSLVQSLALPISDVIPLSRLRFDYRPFEARRRLCDSHDIFFADRRIIPLLPRLIGKQFFKKKNIPLPLDLGRKSWPEQLKQCLGSTFLYLRSGTCSGLKVGRLSQKREEIVDNVMAAIEGAVQLVPKKWSNVRSLHLKSSESMALPIYQVLPEQGLRIEALSKREKREEDCSVVEDEEPRKEKKPKVSVKKSAKTGRIHEMQSLVAGFETNDDVDDVLENEVLEEGETEDLVVEEEEKKKKNNKAKKEDAEDGKEKLNKEKTGMEDGLKKQKSLDCKSMKKIKKGMK